MARLDGRTEEAKGIKLKLKVGNFMRGGALPSVCPEIINCRYLSEQLSTRQMSKYLVGRYDKLICRMYPQACDLNRNEQS